MNFYDRILTRSGGYQRCFLDEHRKPTRAGEIVLADLARFCRSRSSSIIVSPISGMSDTHATFAAEGRREVWLRIMQYLNLDERAILQMRESEQNREAE